MAYIYDPDNKFGYKDELPITCDEKVIRGTDFDAEFLRIQAGVGDSFDETNAGLQQEIEDRIAGDQNLQDQINNLDNSEILGDLNAEIQARIEGDQALQDQIDDLLAQPGAGMVIQETEPTEEERVPGLQWLDSTTAEVWIWDGERWLEFPSAEGPAGPPGADGDAYWEQSGNNIYYDGGNVGVGMEPETATFKLSAKEQLAEWKTKAKASTWSEVTDGEFSQEPTEDLVAEWIEERSVHYQNSKLQLKGYLGFGLNGGAILKVEDPGNSASGSGLVTLGVTALSDSSKRWFSFGESLQDNAEGLRASILKVTGGALRVGVGASDTKGLLINEAGDVTFDNNVGVGTSDISELAGKPTIHVNDGSGNGAIRIGNGANDGGNVFLDHSDADGARIRSNSTDMNIGAGAGQDLHFFTGSSGNTRLTIDEIGNVGIGMDPVDGYGYTAEEQLAEWKEKAKKASWTAVTDGAFEEEPTEELVERWIETRAPAVNLHLNGSVNAVDSVRASVLQTNNGNTAIGLQINGDTSRLYARANGTIYRELIGGIQFADSGIAPAHGFGVLDKDFDYDIGTNDYPFKDGYFSGTVTASGFKGTNFFRPGNGTQDTGGFKFTTANSVRPIDGTGTLSNGVFNLGDAGYRFKDGYFSGTVTADSLSARIGTYFKSSTLAYASSVNSALQAESTATGNYKNILKHEDGWLNFHTNSSITGWKFETINGIKATINSGGDAAFSGSVSDNQGPLMSKRGLISTLSTLRNATKDETTLEGLRDSIGNAIGGLIEKFEAEIAAMPAPEPEVSTMEIPE
jgi:hypothetical protein